MKKITLFFSLLLLSVVTYGQVILFEENFDGDAIPSNWFTQEEGDGGQVWTFGSGVIPGETGTGSGDFPTNAAIFDDDASGGDGNHDKAYLLFPVAIGTIDLTDYLGMQITLEYEYAMNVLSPNDDSLELLISDGEDDFIVAKSYGVDTDITLDTVDVTQMLIDNPGMDVTNFFFKFVYDDIDSDYSWGAGIDNIRLIATPMNDLCENAIPLTIGGEFSDHEVEGTLLGSGMEHRPWEDVWYTVVVPSSGGFTVETAQDAGSVMDDTWLEVHEGACVDLSAASRIASDDDSGTGSFSKITITGRTPGEVLFVHVGKDGSYSGVLDTFLVSAYAIPPVNDLCTGAISVTVGEDFNEFEVEGTLLGAGDEDGFGPYRDVFFSFVVPESGSIVAATGQASGSPMHSTYLFVLSGVCGGLTSIDSNGTGGADGFSRVELSGLTPGETLYIKVEELAGSDDPLDRFMVAVYDPTVGIAEAVVDGLNMYPNPVNDVLNLTAQNKIDSVSIFNLLGQVVLHVAPSTTTAQVDMSDLPTGAYIVKVQAGEQVGSYNLIKE